ncbi:MAG TPA: efflux transporter outer membrane subunit [Planctomycetota bacterium]|nr:efflux transporter outer membrane subunit [Planctomycetota bacterium]
MKNAHRRPALRAAALAAVLLATSACAVGPDYEPPRPSLRESWSALEEAGPEDAHRPRARTADLAEWWTSFGDPALASLVARALEENLELREAASRVREARALRGVVRGGLFPEASVRAGYERLRWSERGLFPTDGEAFDLLQAGFDASWEIDVFGGRRRDLEAATADLDSAVEALRDVRVSLAAEVARNYVELRGLQTRLEVARRNLEAQRRTAALVRARVDAGRASEFDGVRAQGQADATAAALPELEAGVRRAVHRLGVLLGRDPGSLVPELAAAGRVPAPPSEIPIGLPADLLRRRPDVRRAERQLAAATARVGAAAADLYPRFFLLGFFRTESLETSDLFTAASRAWSFGPSIQWPFFQGGRIRARVEAQDARREQAAIRFERAVLGALQDVEDALVTLAREQTRRAALSRAAESRRRAVELAGRQYAEGLADLLSVLDAERALYETEDLLVRSEEAVSAAAIALYKAVGGGWTP